MKRVRDVMSMASASAARALRPGHVYLVVEREYRRVGVPCVVTVGKTVDIVRRMSEYPRGTRIVSTDWVKDMDGMEKTIIREFTATFPRRRDLGLEYFQVEGAYTDGEGVATARALFSRLVAAAPFGDAPYEEPAPVPPPPSTASAQAQAFAGDGPVFSAGGGAASATTPRPRKYRRKSAGTAIASAPSTTSAGIPVADVPMHDVAAHADV